MRRTYHRVKLPLGAYQMIELFSEDLGEQFTAGGLAPRTLRAAITSPFHDQEQFKNLSVTLLMSELAQRRLIHALKVNLHPDSPSASRYAYDVGFIDYAEIDT